MSDAIKHECGIALIHLKKDLAYFKKKYGSSMYAINKMYLMMEKQHNRGQDGAGLGCIKLNVKPGQRYISRVRSNGQQPIQDIFKKINKRVSQAKKDYPDLLDNPDLFKQEVPFAGEILLGHLRYGTFGKNSIESVHPFLRQNNWMHRNLIVAGNFNLTNVNELFDTLVDLGQHPKERADTITVMEKIGHFLDDAVAKIYKTLKKEGYNKVDASPQIAERLNMKKVLRKASKKWDGGYTIAGMLGHGDSFVMRDPAGIRPAYYYDNDELLVVASERPVIQTVFDIPFEDVHEIPPGHALLTKKSGAMSINKIQEPVEKKSCSFERIYFSRGSDAIIYKERKQLGRLLFPQIQKAISNDLENTVFSFIPNTAETSFYGLLGAVQDNIVRSLSEAIKNEDNLKNGNLKKLLSLRPRIEKIAIKDAKLLKNVVTDYVKIPSFESRNTELISYCDSNFKKLLIAIQFIRIKSSIAVFVPLSSSAMRKKIALILMDLGFKSTYQSTGQNGISEIWKKNSLLILIGFNQCSSWAKWGEVGVANAGTATEQVVGLGIPCVSFPAKGHQFNLNFAKRQSRLLGGSVAIAKSYETLAKQVEFLLNSDFDREIIGLRGVQRMGPEGGSHSIALSISNHLSQGS